jgi:hypothetical protein
VGRIQARFFVGREPAACAALYKLGTMLAGNTAMRYAAGLLPLSLFALVANKMFFVSSTAMFLLNSPSQLPVFNQPTLSAIQVVTVLAGLAGTLFTSMKIHGNEKNRAALCFTLAVAAVFSLIFVWQSILTKTYLTSVLPACRQAGFVAKCAPRNDIIEKPPG